MQEPVPAIDELRRLRELRDRDAIAVEVENDRPDTISIWIGPAIVRPIPVIGGVTIAEVVSVGVFRFPLSLSRIVSERISSIAS